MKIIEAHIQNFGKIHDTKISFDENLNLFLHENGWGKTTLSVFVKAMFYGMETTTSRDINKNEKKKYAPWQGGTYGGTLTFSHAGHEYRISRTFGLKAGEDTFELIDLKTNQKSEDFSENLGTELFGVSRDTYGRSAYVTLDEIPENTTDISAKLNSLVEEGDVSNFDGACSNLDKKATAIKAKRGDNDELTQLQNIIDAHRRSLEDISARLKSNERLLEMIDDEQKRIDELNVLVEQTSRQIADSARYESRVSYERLVAEVSQAKSEKEAVEAFFNGNVPSDETVSNIDSLCARFRTVESNIRTQSANQSQKDEYAQLSASFAGDVPSKEQIAACLKEDQDYRAFRQTAGSLCLSRAENEEFDRLNTRFADADISEAVINGCMADVEAVQVKKGELAGKTAALSAKEADCKLAGQTRIKNPLRLPLVILGVLLLAAGAVSVFLKLTVCGIALAAAGVAAGVTGALLKAKKADTSALESEVAALKEQVALQENEIRSIEMRYRSFIARYAPGAASELVALSSISSEYGNFCRLRDKKKAYESWLSGQKAGGEYEGTIRAFMKRYCKTDDISSVPSDIQTLNERISKLEELKKLINADSSNADAMTELTHKLDEALAVYQSDKTTGYAEQVQMLHDRLTTLENCRKNVAAAEARLSEFLETLECDVSSLATVEKPEKTVTELKGKLTGETNEIKGRTANISKYQKQVDDNLTFTDRKEDIESEIEDLTARKQEKSAERNLYLKTLELLCKAKDNLDRNYSKGMIDGFNKYVGLLGTDLKLAIDKDLNVSVDAEGKFHERGYLSEGLKDMVNFCSRMALVDALFEDVKPPVILDDPFVNLDDAKLQNALALVKTLSQNRQVLYFACHESRKPEN